MTQGTLLLDAGEIDLGPDEKKCPMCEVGILSQHVHLYDVNTAGSLPDCSWWECDSCDFQTEPE